MIHTQFRSCAIYKTVPLYSFISHTLHAHREREGDDQILVYQSPGVLFLFSYMYIFSLFSNFTCLCPFPFAHNFSTEISSDLSMESKLFDNVKFEKERAIARFNRSHRVAKLWQIIEVSVLLGLVSWCSTRAPAVLRLAGGYFAAFSNYLFNHHVVFLIGNAIIVLLLTLFRDSSVSISGGRDFYDDYVKYSEAAAAAHSRDSALPPRTDTEDAVESGGGDCEKQIVVRAEEKKPISQCDDLAAVIEKASRQIERFQRTQSEILKREITVRRAPLLRRSETNNCRKADSSDAAEIEKLSNEEFRRRVDAFIDKHWIKKTTAPYQLKNA